MAAGENSWEEDYRRRGRLWGGSASFHPRLPQSLRILELGCGNGKTVSSLLQAGCSVTAIDFSASAASLCRNGCRETGRVEILIADGRSTPFIPESFDVIIASHIAGHLFFSERKDLAGEALRLLVPGGTLYFRDFSHEDFRYGSGLETEPGTFLRKTGIATHYFTREEVRDLFSGFCEQFLELCPWEMRIRGTVFQRAEIVGEFKKSA